MTNTTQHQQPHSPVMQWEDLALDAEKLDLTQVVEFQVGTLDLQIIRGRKEITDLNICCRDRNHEPIANFALNELSLRNGQWLVNELLSIRGLLTGNLTAAGDPLSELSRLSSILEICAGEKIPVVTDAGQNVTEALTIVAERLAEQMTPHEWKDLFTVRKIHPGIVHVSARNSLLSAYAFFRFQEHYESPGLAGEIFSREKLRAYYEANSPAGGFTYLAEWSGFNFPDYVAESFKTNKRWKLNEAEKCVLDTIGEQSSPYYVIATTISAEGLAYAKHEAAHGLWRVDSEYRERAQEILGALDLDPLKAQLLKNHYREDVLDDECHAYLIDGPGSWKDQGLDVKSEGKTDLADYRAAHRKLERLFRKYFNEQQVR